MSENHPIPKGVSLDTLLEIVVGWEAVGAASEPCHTADVAEETGISDAVGRQTRFLEAVGVLAPEGQRHRLTADGADLAAALAADETDRARRRARDLLRAWPVTRDITGLVRSNPLAEDRLIALVAALTGHDPDTGRVRSGVSTLLELLAWVDLLARDEGRYRLPADGSAAGGARAANGQGVDSPALSLRVDVDADPDDLAALVGSVREGLLPDEE